MFSSRPIFDPPSLQERILTAPLRHVVQLAYRVTSEQRWAPRPETPIKVVCISDTHTMTYPIPDGDLLIHAGDMAEKGSVQELQAQIDWLQTLPHKHKVAIAGNHDTYLDARSRATLKDDQKSGQLDWGDIHYLQHSSVTLAFPDRRNRKLVVYGAPQIPKCGGRSFAFQYNSNDDAWSDTIPGNVDVLVTHTPARYHRDLIMATLGCRFLLKEIWRVKPKLHVFGHIHAAAGRSYLWWDEAQRAYETNAARAKDGLLADVLSIWRWIDLLQVVVYGTLGVVWSQVWGGAQRRTIAVNAALMYNSTGVLGNPVQVVEI